MQKITRRPRRERPWLRWVLLTALLAVLAALAVVLPRLLAGESAPQGGASGMPEGFAAPAGVTLAPAASAEEPAPASAGHDEPGPAMTALAVTLPDGTSWTAERTGPEELTVRADGSVYPMRAAAARAMIRDAEDFTVRSVLARDASALPEPLSAYGLDPPRMTVTITYEDGSVLALRIGGEIGGIEDPCRYLMAEDDPRLYALDVSTVEDFAYEAPILRAFTQPVLHYSRIDRVEVEDADGLRVWALEAGIADPDADDRWVLKAPFRYPCDGEMLRSLRRNIQNISLAALVGDATPENRTAYGFDAPRARITVHQAAGRILGAGASGAVEEQDWEEDTFELLVGDPVSDVMDRVLWAGSIWTIPHFRLAGVLDLTPSDSLTRYPVLTALSNLRRLTLTEGETTRVWTLEREAADGGERVTVYRDGEEMAWSVFEANYNRLLMTTVSGRLPADVRIAEPPHTVFTFETETGVTHTIALSTYTSLQDAVTVDGETVFYIAKGVMVFGAEEMPGGTARPAGGG